jgi:hypothetical protein
MKEEQLYASAFLWLDDMRSSDKWDLSYEQVCILLGGLTVDEYLGYIKQAKEVDQISIDKTVGNRLGYFTVIHKNLFEASPEGYQYDFFKRPIDHPIFKKKSIRDFLISTPEEASFIEVIQYIRSKSR